MRRFALLLVVLLAVSTIPAHAQTALPDTDGIPANCENATSPYADPNLFPRYANGQLALIDWSSGDTVRVLEADSAASNFWLLGWSPDCHYLTGGLGDGERYTTILWDATSGAQIGMVEDGYRRPHFLTWSPRGDALVVETRHGAFLWDLATGSRLQLTVDAFYGRSFTHINWDYQTNTISTLTRAGTFVVFSLETGRPLNFVVADDQYISSGSRTYTPSAVPIVTAPDNASPYGCMQHYWYHGTTRAGQILLSEQIDMPNIDIVVSQNHLILVDAFTGELTQVLDEEFSQAVRPGRAYGNLSPHCDMFFTLLFMDRERYFREGVVIRISDGMRLHTVLNMPNDSRSGWYSPTFHWLGVRQLPRFEWDATGRYLFAQSYDGAQVWDSATDRTFYVTSADESRRYGYSVNTVTWDGANGRISVDMLYSTEVRVFDLATGQRVG